MRWEFVPVIFGLAGAAGGALDARLSGVVMGAYGDTAELCAYIGGGIGLGIGCAMCLSQRFWVRLGSAPFLGTAGYFLLTCVSCLPVGEWTLPHLGKILSNDFSLYLAAPAAPVLVAAHHLHLRMRDRGVSPYASMLLYAVMGALSGSVFWFRDHHLAGGLLNGALYGLCQHVAMMVAQRLERWRAEPEPAQGFSPRQ